MWDASNACFAVLGHRRGWVERKNFEPPCLTIALDAYCHRALACGRHGGAYKGQEASIVADWLAGSWWSRFWRLDKKTNPWADPCDKSLGATKYVVAGSTPWVSYFSPRPRVSC
jgi:hypothetical protein